MASPTQSPATATELSRIGLVVHPTRNVDEAIGAARDWAAGHGAELVQISVPGRRRDVTREGRPEDCDLIVSVGGDGTMLAAARAALDARRPVLGVACGSLGALTSVAADGVRRALDRFAAGEWRPRPLAGLEVSSDRGDELVALNDIAVVRGGQGQIRTTAKVDADLYGRFAGDGCIVSTPAGSSAYALAAGGPLLALSAEAFLLTPLTVHGGFCPPLVIGAGSRLELEIDVGHGGARFEVDGQVTDLKVGSLRVSLRAEVATLVGFDDQESLLAGLRRRRIIIDSPRIVADRHRA
ncbi:MAG: NAD(+)/NADH kinase [Solirubrobacterales bacterium]|nr:NAD(+)/NADH kinase [Solirubrobacterales bacterium]MBV9717473.1 NAD(+)/NADH kinase [Solirubrobacterales bacterium]